MSIADRIATVRKTRAVGKAISHKPDLAYRVHVSSQSARGQAAEAIEDYGQVYAQYAWVHKAVGLLSNAFAPLPVRVVDANGKELVGHPITSLLSAGNDRMSAVDVWQQWLVDMMLSGEAFQEIVLGRGGQAVELWPRKPADVLVVPDVSPERILYPRVAAYTMQNETVRIEPEGMIHSRFYNPLSLWRGLAPITAVREGITIDLFAQAWSKTFLRDGARPDFALIAPAGMTTTEKEELLLQLVDNHQGSDNWHRPIVLEQGITDIKPFSWAPKDLEWLQQREFSRDEVAAVFGVPDELMGYGRDTYENFDTAHRVFWQLTVTNLTGHRDVSLTHFFSRVRRDLKPGQRIETDLSGVAALQEDLLPKLEQADKLWSKGVPFNTIDERLGLGIGKIEGGDVGFVPMGITPIAQAVKEPEPVPEQLRPENQPDPEEDTEPEPEEEDDEESPEADAPDEEGPPDTEERSLTAQVQALLAYLTKGAPLPREIGIEYGSPLHVAIWKSFDDQARPHEREMVPMLKRAFQRQQNAVLAALRDYPWPRELAAYAGLEKAEQKRQLVAVSVNELMDWQAEIDILVHDFEQYYMDVVEQFGSAAIESLSIGMVWDQSNPLVQAAIKRMTIKFAKDISETTQQRMIDVLRAILEEAEAAGMSIPQVQARIYDDISTVFNVRKSDYETERIARTEVIKAANMGKMEGYRQSGVVEKKSWLAGLDNRTRETHIEAHRRYQAEPIALDAQFEVGGDTMDAPGGGGLPEENIFCRCVALPVVKEVDE